MKSLLTKSAILLIIAVIPQFGCEYLLPQQHSQMSQKDIYEMKLELQEFRNQQAIFNQRIESYLQASQQSNAITLRTLEESVGAVEQNVRQMELHFESLQGQLKELLFQLGASRGGASVAFQSDIVARPPAEESEQPGPDEDSLSGDDLYYAGLSNFQQARFERAVEQLSQFIEAGSNESLLPEAIYYQGMCLLELGRYQESLEIFKTLIENTPKPELMPSALFGMAKAHSALEQTDEAKSLLDGIIQRYPAYLDLNQVIRLRNELE